MRPQNIYRRNTLIISYNTKRIYTLMCLINLKCIIVEFLKIKDKIYYISNNFNSFLRLHFLKSLI